MDGQLALLGWLGCMGLLGWFGWLGLLGWAQDYGLGPGLACLGWVGSRGCWLGFQSCGISRQFGSITFARLSRCFLFGFGGLTGLVLAGSCWAELPVLVLGVVGPNLRRVCNELLPF